MTNDEAIAKLDDIEPKDSEEADALDAAGDALAFTNAIWALLKEQGFIEPGSEAIDYALMENVIDGINGELAAVCLFLASSDETNTITTRFRAVADSIELRAPEGIVPAIISKGYRRIASRIDNIKISIGKAKELVAAAEAEKASAGG